MECEGHINKSKTVLVFIGLITVVSAGLFLFSKGGRDRVTARPPIVYEESRGGDILRRANEKFDSLITRHPIDKVRIGFRDLVLSGILHMGLDTTSVLYENSEPVFGVGLVYPDGSRPQTVGETHGKELVVRLAVNAQLLLDNRISDEHKISFFHHEYTHILQILKGTVERKYFVLSVVPQEVDSVFVASVYEAEAEAYLEQSILAVDMGIVDENEHFIEYKRGGYPALRLYVADEVSKRFPKFWRDFLLAKAKAKELPRNRHPTTQRR